MKKLTQWLLTASLCFGFLGLFEMSSVYAQADSGQCTYGLDQKSVVIGYTAYKTTQKVGVKGSFKKSDVHGKLTASSFSGLLQGLQVTVDLSSSDTANPVRDKTLADFFFSKLKPAVSGKIKNVSEQDKTFVLDLDLNGKHHDVPMTYAVAGESSFSATGTLNLTDFDGDSALTSLHIKCSDLHKGPDKVSKTWPDVTLNLKGVIAKSCK